MSKLAMVVLLMLISCGVGNGKDGLNGLNGHDGRPGVDGSNYYSYMVGVSIQEIIGDDQDELVDISESTKYQLPKSFEVTVDNLYPECRLRDVELVIESDDKKHLFIFQATENRYQMRLKSGPVNKVVDSSSLKVYYQKVPEADCGGVVYRLHSGVSFEIRVIQRLEIE